MGPCVKVVNDAEDELEREACQLEHPAPVVNEQPKPEAKWCATTFRPVDTASEEIKKMFEEEFIDELEEILQEEKCYDA
ncbi:hypothetical protein CVT24_007390 [Panaeolus cyanescens]|uniref:Uncharacterized protein n=1 Tax=Panaeolus cyanescens TaxID=181874 RepID=A0A409YL42_9AGAR|nr:hypothetical protein CVT24_007390 [Panaeolus cyanescens]